MTEIPALVKDFLEAYIESLDGLEILLFLRNNSEGEWDAAAVSGALALNDSLVAARLDEFKRAGLIQERGGRLYQFKPSSRVIGKAVDELASAYSVYPSAVLSLIRLKASSRMRLYPESLRSRNKKE